MQPKSPYLTLSLGVVAVSFAAIFIKLSTAPALAIASYRMLFACLCLSPVAWWRYRNELKSISRQNWALMACSGVFLALHFATWISSFRFTSVTSSTVLVSTQPIFAAVFSWVFFRERLSRRQIFALLIAIAGSIIIGLVDAGQSAGELPLWGNTLALLGGICAAGYFLCGKAVRQQVSVLPYVCVVYGISAILLIIIATAIDVPLYPYSQQDFLLFLGLAVVCTVVGHSILNWSLAKLPTTAVGIAVLGEPIGASLWAALIFSELPSGGQLLGGGLLLCGILLFMLQPSRAASEA